MKISWFLEVLYGLVASGPLILIIKSTPHALYWVIPNDDSYFAPGALATIAAEVDTTAFNFLDINPKWSCVIPGEGAVLRAGLWDEVYHPIYYDDDDYEWRMEKLGVRFNTIPAKVYHDNSSTLRSGFSERNDVTFQRNRSVFTNKKVSENTGILGWSLKVRRENRWD